ncbi:LOW QUALITY PROTEIN: hypothetical protein CFOL_v3_08632, partial [Cephalotus follicularis]
INAQDLETSSTSFPSKISSSLTFSDRKIETPLSISTFLTNETKPIKKKINLSDPKIAKRNFFLKKEGLGFVSYLLLAKEIADLDGGVGVCDGGVDGEVGIDEAHLVAVALGDTGDEVLNVAECGADGGAGLAGAEPGLDLELALRCLKLRMSFPRGPSTSIILAFTLILTPSGMSMVSDDKMVFISLCLSNEDGEEEERLPHLCYKPYPFSALFIHSSSYSDNILHPAQPSPFYLLLKFLLLIFFFSIKRVGVINYE